MKSQENHEVDPKEILESFRRSQVMQSYAICQGVTAKASGQNSFIRGYSQNMRHASYHFHPFSEKTGKVKYFVIECRLYLGGNIVTC